LETSSMIPIHKRILAKFVAWLDRVTAPPAPSVQPGEVWRLRPIKGNPWAKQGHDVRVLDVRGGWVRYEAYGADDNAMRLGMFKACFERES
jgi:hypothetical protein